jgi:heat-inducible transcriptional repressor
MLTERQSRILEFVIRDYVETAVPVASQFIRRKYRLKASAATIRNEMAELEAQGYLSQPYTSSGRVPTNTGYRFYVEGLMREEELPWEAQQTIRHQFHQVERGQEAWMHLAASILARLVENAAVVTAPRTDACRIKHLELVSLHDYTLLLVLVVDQARLEQQILALEEARTQDELTEVAGRLNRLFAGLTVNEVAAQGVELTPLERQVVDALEATMRAVDGGGFDEAYLEGLRHVLGQPEFASNERTLGLLELLDEHNLIRAIPLRALAGEGVTVIFGADSPRLAEAGEAMRACSVVVGAYGAPGMASGALAVLGPVRMRYPRAISTVRYMSNVMSELLSEYQD